MIDYFGDNNTGASGNTEQAPNTNGAAQPAVTNGDDLGMDEISVSRSPFKDYDDSSPLTKLR